MEWIFVPTGAVGNKQHLWSDGGALYLDILANSMVILSLCHDST